jgi:hypothetical protein
VIPLLIVGAVVLFALTGILKHGQRRLDQHGIHALTWRWLTGQPWHGKPLTNAGWKRPGKGDAFTPTKHAPRFHYRPRWQRTVIRVTETTVSILILSGLIVNFWLTVDFLAGACAGLAVLGCWRAWLRWQRRKHRRAWVEPAHAIVAPMVGWPVVNPPHSWLAVEQDRSRAVFQLPPGRDFSDPHEQEKIVRAASRVLGIEMPEPSWALAGPEHTLTIAETPPPPDEVLCAHIWDILTGAGPDTLVIGIGRDGRPVTIDLDGDSPHVGLSMGSGGGKSVTCGLILAQMLYRGCLGVVLDIKRISHTWARGLPNVAYARDVEEIHDMLIALAKEGDRRNRIADDQADIEGKVRGSVGPRIVVIAEELNTMMKRLRAYWQRERGPGAPRRSPALDALDELLAMGRQVRINVIMIGQRLSAAATGGSGDARENLAALILARFKPATWKMLIPDLPMPPRTKHKLRGEVVTDEAKTVQIALLTGAERRRLALAGRISKMASWCPEMPCAGTMQIPETVPQDELPGAAEQAFDTVTSGKPDISPPAVSAAEPVTLSAAVQAGILPMTLAAVRTARHREDTFPKPVARNGLAHLYDPVELDDWFRRRSAV